MCNNIIEKRQNGKEKKNIVGEKKENNLDEICFMANK